MRNVRSTTIVVLAILFLFRFWNISGSSDFGNQKAFTFSTDTVIEDLIFNARYDQAIVIADKAIDQITDSYSKIHLLLKLCEICIYKNNPEKAAEILQEVALCRINVIIVYEKETGMRLFQKDHTPASELSPVCFNNEEINSRIYRVSAFIFTIPGNFANSGILLPDIRYSYDIPVQIKNFNRNLTGFG